MSTKPFFSDAAIEAACRVHWNAHLEIVKAQGGGGPMWDEMRERPSMEIMRSALEAAIRANWRPIEDAEKDEGALVSSIILTEDGARGEAEAFEGGVWYWAGCDPSDAHDGSVDTAIRYMPVPPAPEA